MSNPNQSPSRRKWLGLTPTLAAASVGTGLLAPRAMADDQPPAAGDNSLGAKIYNVRDFGAKGDSTTLDTAAIQAAIDACTKDQGGTVLVPAGSFLTGPIELKSNVTLRIVAGGKLLGSTDPKQYHPANGIPLQGDHTMGDGNTGLVYAANATNVTIEGPGTIDGQGRQLRANGLGGKRRAHLTLFYRCTNLTVRDVYLFHSGYHTCRICNCTYVQLNGVRIFSRTVSNNDGFHFISAQHVAVSNCDVRCQDDACAMFGSCQFITITNSLFSTRWSAFRFGTGIANNIAVSNCLLYQVFGCPVKLRCDSGSRFENMSFSNLVFDQVTGPIIVAAGPQHLAGAGRRNSTPVSNAPGVIRNISFNNISGNVIGQQDKLDDSTFASGTNPGELHSCITLNCVKGNVIKNISFNGIRLTFGGGGTAEMAARRDLPSIANEYFSLGPMPAYAFYARNVRGLTLAGVRFETATPDLRPALVLDHVTDATVNSLNVQGNKDAMAAVCLVGAQDVLLSATRLLTPAAVFLQVEGADNGNIIVDGGDISKAAAPLAFKNGASESSVKLWA
ncbi:MAG TPA: glycosyl hydrolase family 28 protein [Candidatus Aquilonibacter sp.]|nr:glycosyl hydrolase family 28 protein [Candidatus Aquilonibacter sp.]